MSGTSFLDHFSGLEDPRQLWKVSYPLPEPMPSQRSGAEQEGRGEANDFSRVSKPCAGLSTCEHVLDGRDVPPTAPG